MGFYLPKGHLSATQVGDLRLCGLRYKIFTAEGHVSPPDFALEVKRKTHESLLDFDLQHKVDTGKNREPEEVVEYFDRSLRSAAEEIEEKGDAGKETDYFQKIVNETRPFQEAVNPVSIEKEFNIDVGGVPVTGRIDIVNTDNVLDYKRRAQAYPKGYAAKSLQMVTYAVAERKYDVGTMTIVETARPRLEPDLGHVQEGDISRVVETYQKTAEMVSAGIFLPVDKGNKHTAWVCSAKYCGAWRRDAKDWKTGADISCPYGERSEVRSK